MSKVSSDLLLAIISVFVPPLPVFIKKGLSVELVINVALTCLGGFPGVVHSWYVILKNPDDGIPFLTERFEYQSVDEESAPNTSFGPSGNGPASEGATDHGDLHPSSTAPVQSGSLSNRDVKTPIVEPYKDKASDLIEPEASTSGAPPPYVDSGTAVADNKIQYNDY